MTNRLNNFLRRCLGIYHEDRNSPSLTFVNSESFFKKRHFLYPLEHTLKQLRYQYSSCTFFYRIQAYILSGCGGVATLSVVGVLVHCVRKKGRSGSACCIINVDKGI